MNPTAIVTDLLAVYSLLSGMVAQVYDADIMTVARAIDGEAAGWFGDQRGEVGAWIAHTAYNRWMRPWWRVQGGQTLALSELTLRDFHGTANVQDPEVWAVGIARSVILSRLTNGHDPTGECVFMLSLTDIETNGWREKAETLVVRRFTCEKGELWFFRQWPG